MPFSSVYLHFLNFLASLDLTASCSRNSERLTIEVYKFGKATSKNLNDKEHGQSKYEEFEAFKGAILLSEILFESFFFSMDKSYKFLIASFRGRD